MKSNLGKNAISNAPVYTMPHERQVALLADALLREYMHRRGFVNTLRAFDSEHPRDESTISSRALMADLMALPADVQQRLKADGVETIMEMLCNLCLERQARVRALTAQAQAAIPVVPVAQARLSSRTFLPNRSAHDADHSSHPRTSHDDSNTDFEKSHLRRVATEDEDKEDSDSGSNNLTRQRASSHRRHSRQRTAGSHHTKHASHKSTKARRRHGNDEKDAAREDDRAGEFTMTIDDLLGGDASSGDDGPKSPTPAHPAPRSNDAAQDESKGHGNTTWAMKQRRGANATATPGSSNDGSASAASSVRYGNNLSTAPTNREAMLGEDTIDSMRGWNAQSNDTRTGDNQTRESSTTAPHVHVEAGGNEILPPGASWLTRAELSALCRVLYHGIDSESVCIRASLALLQQGLLFDSALEYALIQLHQGVGAVLAPIQALLVGCYYEKEVYVETAVRQRECLCRALVRIITRAQPDVRRVVLVGGHVCSSAELASASASSSSSSSSKYAPCIREGVRALLSWWNDTRSHREVSNRNDPYDAVVYRDENDSNMTAPLYSFRGFDSTQALSVQVLQLLECEPGGWCTPRGGGLWCVLASVLLSRGVSIVQEDMLDERGTFVSSLLDVRSGYGTVALAHLMLTGQATRYSNTSSSSNSRSRSNDQAGKRLDCGFVDADAASAATDVGNSDDAALFPMHKISNSNRNVENSDSTSADDPVWPSWVVHHAGHFSNLFMKRDVRKSLAQKRALGGEATVELTYWDPASGDDEFNLKVSVGTRYSARDVEARHGGGRGSDRASYVNCAIHRISPWHNAVIDWNDEVPPRG